MLKKSNESAFLIRVLIDNFKIIFSFSIVCTVFASLYHFSKEKSLETQISLLYTLTDFTYFNEKRALYLFEEKFFSFETFDKWSQSKDYDISIDFSILAKDFEDGGYFFEKSKNQRIVNIILKESPDQSFITFKINHGTLKNDYLKALKELIDYSNFVSIQVTDELKNVIKRVLNNSMLSKKLTFEDTIQSEIILSSGQKYINIGSPSSPTYNSYYNLIVILFGSFFIGFLLIFTFFILYFKILIILNDKSKN